MYERSKQKQRDNQAKYYIIEHDTLNQFRPCSLYLRAFYTSSYFRRLQVRNSEYKWFWPGINNIIGKNIDLETLIACIAERSSFLIGIGRSFTLSGSGKVTPSDSEWKKKFWYLAESSKYIIHVVANRPGTRWEFKQIIGSESLSEKTIFLVPGSISGLRSIGLSRRLTTDYSNIRSELKDIGYNLPGYKTQGMILVYNSKIDKFISYPSGLFNFKYLKKMFDLFQMSISNNAFTVNCEFLRMFGPVRDSFGRYYARAIIWDEGKFLKSQSFKNSLDDGNCFISEVQYGEFYPYTLDNLNPSMKFVVANPKVYLSSTIISKLRKDSDFFNIRDLIIMRAKGFIVALKNLSLQHQRPYVLFHKSKEMWKEHFKVNDDQLEKIYFFLKKNSVFLNWEERYLWEQYINFLN
jgi:hypothetical protein